ncbi:thiolase family protein [Nesterenkonia muleiensis]|uniref:thiolase family protein n=1 Tax=Nesterenkonia muleiensis TaxID=2282648 RepID=UPI000E72A731|nr:thiolase family protein [Nesterenkonia muleiensis]
MKRREPIMLGAGSSDFGKQSLNAEQLVTSAVAEALEAANLTAWQVDAIYLGTVFPYAGTAHRAMRAAGFAATPLFTVENACASGTLAFHLGSQAVRLGEYSTVLIVGFEKMSSFIKGAIPTDPGDLEALQSMQLPSMYALTATRYMHQYGVTPEQLAQVSVKNHAHALHNPRAQYRGQYTVEEVLSSRPISDPLTLLQCSPISDGAAAAVLRAREMVDDDAGGVRVLASHFESGALWPDPDHDQVWNWELIHRTTAQAMAAAGLRHGDIDLCEVHDAFTIGELVTIEAMGFCPEGQGAAFTEDGQTTYGGSIPVNPSGGLLSRGHPLGATGVAQVAEMYWQLTGIAGPRQVPDASRGLVETMGGSASGLSGNGCVVAAFETFNQKVTTT